MNTTHADDEQRVDDFSTGVRDATAADAVDLVADHYRDDAVWHGPAPVGTLEGVDAIAGDFFEPLLASFPDVQKDDYVLFGGSDGDERWVATAGHLAGTFEADWLGIPATDGATWLRYGEFHRVEADGIAESYVCVDVLDAMRQAGYRPFPSLGEEIVAPGPSTGDGVRPPREEARTERTHELVGDMVFEGLFSYDGDDLAGMGMDDYWHDDFSWYGPGGIGTTRGVDGFQAYHQGPFLEAFPDRDGGDVDAWFSAGDYSAMLGWPDLTATHTGSGWLGLPATGREVEMRVMDVWRREGDLLAENWVYIDMVHVLEQLGVDVFDRMAREL